MLIAMAALLVIPGALLGAFTERDDLAGLMCIVGAVLAIVHLVVRDKKEKS